jgi:hypothetical protein
VALAAVALVSALTLLIRFAADAPVPMALLQLAFILLLASGALLLVRLGVAAMVRLRR